MKADARQFCGVRLARLLILAAMFAASICSAQDKRKAGNVTAGKEEDQIKQLISMYAKAADEADPAWHRASGATHRTTH